MMKRRSLLPQAGLNESLNVSMPIEEVDEEAERRGRVRIQRRQSLGLLRPGAIPGSGENIAPVVSTTSVLSSSLSDLYSSFGIIYITKRKKLEILEYLEIYSSYSSFFSK